MGSKTNRSLQAKFVKSRRQAAEHMVDVTQRDAMHVASWKHDAIDVDAEHARRVARRRRLLAHWM